MATKTLNGVEIPTKRYDGRVNKPSKHLATRMNVAVDKPIPNRLDNTLQSELGFEPDPNVDRVGSSLKMSFTRVLIL